jgi:hypothetical protein
MRFHTPAVVLASVVSATFSSAGQQVPSPWVPCDVTIPNGSDHSYGNELLKTYLWPDGNIEFKAGGPGFITSRGALGMKFPWERGVAGKLGATGRRLDADAPPLESEFKCCYGKTGFQASYLIFPTPGCWEVTAQIGERDDSRLTFITRIVKIGDGPTGRYDPPR